MVEISEIDDFKKITKKENWKIFGIGGLPETRSEACFISDDFEIICSRATGEIEAVQKKIKVNVFDVKNNSKKAEDIISDKLVQDYINSFLGNKKIGIYLFKSSSKIERICKENNWTLIANKVDLFDKLNSREFFFGMLDEIGLKREFEILESSKLELMSKDLFERFGDKFVLQTFNGAGGRGTFFVDKENYKKVFNEINSEGSQKAVVNFYIKGFDVAVTGCVTRENGVIPGIARHQFVGIKEVVDGKDYSRHSFCGNDWNIDSEYASNIQRQAEEYIGKFGKILKREGYLGIFGIDFVFNEDTKELFPLEINPRLIGSYPVETQFEVLNNQLPLSGFHLLEFLDLNYSISNEIKVKNRKTINQQCSHVMLVNFLGEDLLFDEGLQGGVYKLIDNEIVFIRKGFQRNDIKSSEEFILTAGIPVSGYCYKKNNQLLRIIWGRSIKVNNGHDIDDLSKQVIKAVKEKIKSLLNVN